MTHIPTRDELAAFLDRMIVEARQSGDTNRVDDLLDKRANVDQLTAFLQIVLSRD